VVPTVSVLMPAFNAARTIAPAIRSVLAQTRADFELIVVDDGSSDETRRVVEPFLADPRLVLVSQENRGLAGARNAGLAQSRGRFVSPLDADDLWLPRYLETALAVLEPRSPYAYVFPDASRGTSSSSRPRSSVTFSRRRGAGTSLYGRSRTTSFGFASLRRAASGDAAREFT
jgi:glycosyltransferase involved in cell wall biosynthesis